MRVFAMASVAAILSSTAPASAFSDCRFPFRCGPRVGEDASRYVERISAMQASLVSEMARIRAEAGVLPVSLEAGIRAAARSEAASMDKDGDGRVSRPEAFAHFAGGRSIASSLLFANRREAIGSTDAVMAADRDGDGFVSPDELALDRVLKARAQSVARSEAELRELSARAGSADAEQVDRLARAASSLHAALDGDGDGALNRWESQSFEGHGIKSISDLEAYVARRSAVKAAASGQVRQAKPSASVPGPKPATICGGRPGC